MCYINWWMWDSYLEVSGLRRWKQTAVMLAGPVLLGVFVSLCGISLSLGFRKMSVLFFFASVVLLVLMQWGGRLMKGASPDSDLQP